MKSSTYADFVTEDRRLVILKILRESSGRTANCRMLQKGLRAMGHNVTLDQVVSDINWLAERDVIRQETAPMGDVILASLTEAGLDHLACRQLVEGIAEPSSVR